MRLVFLNDTADYYGSDTSRRSVSNGYNQIPIGKCLYHAQNGNKCAIGRHIPEHRYRPSFEDAALKEVIKSVDKPIYDLGLLFLLEMQRFHDVGENWDKDGITELGKKVYKIIYNSILNNRFN